MNSIVLATTNQHKVKELSRLLDGLNVPCQSLADFPHVSWVVEDGQTLLENACKKAIGYAQQLSAWVLADDTGLEVNALDGDHATMAENRAKLLADLATIPESLWSARFVCHLAMANPAGELVAQAMGECMGRLRREPAGEFGFGYDVLFEVTGYGKTLAQLAPDVVDVVGHRAQAVKQLLTRIA
jgi:XTP/dITP diphosphohydrolase